MVASGELESGRVGLPGHNMGAVEVREGSQYAPGAMHGVEVM